MSIAHKKARLLYQMITSLIHSPKTFNNIIQGVTNMKKTVILSLLLIGLFSLQNASATDFGTNITIYDNNSSSPGWYGNQEDQEVEPGCYTGQAWDLEAFFLNGSLLTMVGGYNFVAGLDGWDSGDIFFDVDGNAIFGDIHLSPDGIQNVPNTFGYDYVLDMNFSNLTYNIYSLTANSIVSRTYYGINYGSSPWRYVSGGNDLGNGTIAYLSGLTDAQVGNGLSGGTHNAATVNLGFLGPNVTFISHFTMKCGNDNLMGQGVIPEPGTVLLLGSGMLGLGFMGWYRKRRSIGEK
jgi:hypothetical protein